MFDKQKINLAKLTASLVPTYIENIIFYEKLRSTNDLAKKLGKQGQQSHLILANEQISGRGRGQNSFFSPPDNIYMSCLLFPDYAIEHLPFVTIIASLAVCNAITELTGFEPTIKWQNDIYLHQKKLCGILVETQIITEHVYKYLVIGIGVNVYNHPIPDTLSSIMTNIEKETGIILDRTQLIIKIVEHLFHYLALLQVGDFSFMTQYRAKNFLIGKNIQLSNDEEGIYHVKAVTDEGHLLVTQGEEEKILVAGEVSVRL